MGMSFGPNFGTEGERNYLKYHFDVFHFLVHKRDESLRNDTATSKNIKNTHTLTPVPYLTRNNPSPNRNSWHKQSEKVVQRGRKSPGSVAIARITFPHCPFTLILCVSATTFQLIILLSSLFSLLSSFFSRLSFFFSFLLGEVSVLGLRALIGFTPIERQFTS